MSDKDTESRPAEIDLPAPFGPFPVFYSGAMIDPALRERKDPRAKAARLRKPKRGKP